MFYKTENFKYLQNFMLELMVIHDILTRIIVLSS